MKYEYDVEYPCNGKKPDLPGDVLVEQCYRGHWYREAKQVNKWVSWLDVTAFRIADERYKPKPEDNSWFERGEFPPVGTVCEARNENLRDGEWFSVEILKHRVNDTGTKVAATMSLDDRHLHWLSKFRPIRTEREKVIEAATNVDGSITRVQAETLYDAGLLRLPEKE